MSSSLVTRLFRTQKIAEVGDLQTPLKRCLTTFDLTVMGIAHMIGAGIYVLAGTVLKNVAGPSVVVSFMLSGFAALLCALCYAEFGARYSERTGGGLDLEEERRLEEARDGFVPAELELLDNYGHTPAFAGISDIGESQLIPPRAKKNRSQVESRASNDSSSSVFSAHDSGLFDHEEVIAYNEQEDDFREPMKHNGQKRRAASERDVRIGTVRLLEEQRQAGVAIRELAEEARTCVLITTRSVQRMTREAIKMIRDFRAELAHAPRPIQTVSLSMDSDDGSVFDASNGQESPLNIQDTDNATEAFPQRSSASFHSRSGVAARLSASSHSGSGVVPRLSASSHSGRQGLTRLSASSHSGSGFFPRLK